MKKNLISVFILSCSTFGVGVLSYLYHPIMLRYLDLKEFAEFESLLGMINLLSVVSMAMGLFIVKEFAKSSTEENDAALIHITKKIGLYTGLGIYSLYIILSPLIALFLKIENIWIILLTGSTLLFSFLGIYQGTYFQGKKQFKTISFFTLLNPIFRLTIGIVLVFLGTKVYGAIGGFIITQILLLILGYILIRKRNHQNFRDNIGLRNEIVQRLYNQKSQVLQYFLSSIILAILMNADILFAKHFFADEMAGTYAGISIIAKFLVFVGMSIETVYYPVLTSENTLQKGKIYILSSLYLIVTVGALGFFYLFGEKVLNLFKPGFEQYLNLLYLIIIYCGILALLNFIIKLMIAFEKYLINYLVAVLFLFSIPLLYLFVDTSMYELILVFLVMISCCLVVGLGYLGIQE